jgi:hypothetical protein
MSEMVRELSTRSPCTMLINKSLMHRNTPVIAAFTDDWSEFAVTPGQGTLAFSFMHADST